MTNKKEDKKVEDVKAEKVTETPSKKTTSATVLSGTGNVVRTYTDEHSDKDTGFVEKAKGYAGKIGGTVQLA